MKNKILSIILASMFALTMIGCGNDSSNADVNDSSNNASTSITVDVVEAMNTFIEGQIEGESVPTMELDADMIEQLYGITPDMYTAIAARTPMMSAHCDEYVFVEAADGQVDAITAALEARQAYLVDPMNMGYPEHIDYANEYTLETYFNKYIVFAIGDASEEVVAHFAASMN